MRTLPEKSRLESQPVNAGDRIELDGRRYEIEAVGRLVWIREFGDRVIEPLTHEAFKTQFGREAAR